ncbi:MAG: nucleotidyltransferase family protein, partial [Ruminococcus sp.]|nr:nucleotidyltransferase family protein [Ruminococcus sp.]
SNDIDIYVDKLQIKDAITAMLSEGFTVKSEDNNKGEYGLKKEPRYYVELHTNFEGFSKKQKEILLNFADNANKVSGERYELTDSDNYIYTLFHLYKHFVNSGVGVRMFLDVYLIKKNAGIDFDYVNPILKELDIDGFAVVVDEIGKVLFEGETPSDDLRKVVEFVFDSGIFGTVYNNQHLRKINTGTQHLTKAQRLKMNYGIGFHAMKKRYPILKKLPILYPFSFIHRFFYGLIHKRKVLSDAINAQKSLSADKVDEYKKIFEIAKIKM